MHVWQIISLLIYGSLALFAGLQGLAKSKQKNTHGLTPAYFIFGAFVWADAAIFGIFWFIFSVVSLLFQNWWFFLFGLSVFWVVRSLGEIIYWLNQQFSTIIRVKPKDSWLYGFFPTDSVWFVYQTIWQCVFTLAVILSVYTGVNWVRGL